MATVKHDLKTEAAARRQAAKKAADENDKLLVLLAAVPSDLFRRMTAEQRAKLIAGDAAFAEAWRVWRALIAWFGGVI